MAEQICGNCQFGIRISGDLQRRSCHGNPPQVVALLIPVGVSPTGKPNFRVEANALYPGVAANEPACHLFALDSRLLS